jgi:hypothetical protein
MDSFVVSFFYQIDNNAATGASGHSGFAFVMQVGSAVFFFSF